MSSRRGFRVRMLRFVLEDSVVLGKLTGKAMALHPEFSDSPYAELSPARRWFPAAEEMRETDNENLLLPLIHGLVQAWSAGGYADASPTTQALLRWWFVTVHNVENAVGLRCDFGVVDEASSKQHTAQDFASLADGFRKYKD
jgi:hypothetical protein